MGRHTECTESMIALAREAAAKGLKRELIGPYIGVSRSTFFSWMSQGRNEPESVYGQFLDAVRHGEASGAVLLLDKVAAAADSDWRAAQFLLKTRHGYSEKSEQEVTIKGGTDAASEVAEIEAEIARLRSELGGDDA